MKIGYRPDIDGLRAIAVISVIVFHYFPGVLPGGFIGVDIFFVISGYLISKNILSDIIAGNFKFLDFYARRIRRIFPALILIFLFLLIVGWFQFSPSNYLYLGKHILAGAAFTSNFLLWSESGYFDLASSSKPLLHLWSLGIEEQFYLFWPFFVLMLWGRKLHFSSSIILMIIASFILNLYLSIYNSTAGFYLPVPRAWEFLVGSLLACIESNGGLREIVTIKTKAYANLVGILGALCIGVGIFFISDKSQFPGWWALLPTLGSVLIIQSGRDSLINRLLLSNKIFVWVGLISYPLYLWHWPILVLSHVLGFDCGENEIRILLVALTFVLAFLTFRYIEQPIQKSANKLYKAWMLIAVMTLVAIFSIWICIYQGLPSKLFKPKGIEGAEESILKIIYSESFGQNFRAKKCFLENGQVPENFAIECRVENRTKEIFIWGDSHAASLYPGFSAEEKKNRVSQFTSSTCPPVLSWSTGLNSACKAINSHIISLIQKSPPKTVILYAAWYWDQYLMENNLQSIKHTIDQIYAAGVKNVIILGPPPIWTKNMPDIIFDHIRAYGSAPSRFTNYQLGNLDRGYMIEIDLRKIASETGSYYFSSLGDLCRSRNCMIYVENISHPITMDSGHFSNAGATYIIDKMRSNIPPIALEKK